MATQCRGTKTKRINRHKLAVIQAYIIIGTLVLIGFIGGLVVGRATAPKKQVTVTETVEVPSYEADSLPVAEEVTYFDVPLSHSLQRYIYEVCADENVPVSLIIAMIDQESKFNPEVVSKTGDYGLMQINTINHEWLAEEYRTVDMLDPYQNVFCGIKVIGSYIQNYNDYGLALMAYNMGDYGAKKAWENGIKLQATSRSGFQQATLTRTRATKRLSPTLRLSDYQSSDYRLSTFDYETAPGFPGAFSMQKFTEIFRKSAGHGTHLFTSLMY